MRVSQTGTNPAQSSETSSAKHTGKAGAAAEGKRNEKARSAEAPDTSDSVKADLSAKGREFARAKEVAGGAPDVREEKIAELKRRIAAGKYNVDADAVSDKLVDEHLKMSGMS